MAQRVPPPFAARSAFSMWMGPRVGPATAVRHDPTPKRPTQPGDTCPEARYRRPLWALLFAASLSFATGIDATTAQGTARDSHPGRGSSSDIAHAVPYLGLLLGGTVSDDQVIGLGLSDTELGRVVTSVDPGSPADSAHVRVGDLILRVDGRAMRSPRDLDATLRRHAPGTQLQLVIRRGEETLETPIAVGELPPGDLGFRVGPILDRDPSFAQLPHGFTEADSLPVADWVGKGNPSFKRGGLEVGVLITSLNGREVHSAAEFRAAARSVRVGDDLVVRFRSHGHLRQLRYLAQATPLPWSKLRLEEITPTLVESESLSTVEGETAGLFVRRVEPGSAAEKVGLRARDRILAIAAEPPTAGLDSAAAQRLIAQADSAAMQPQTSVEQFDSLYAATPWPYVSRLRLARRDTVLQVVRLERDWRATHRERPAASNGSPWGFEVSPSSRRPDVVGVNLFSPSPSNWWIKIDNSPLIPVPLPVAWTKVTGVCFGGLTGVKWDATRHSGRSVIQPGTETWDAPTLRTEWRWDYGVGDKRWHHRVDLVGRGPWGPHVTYLDHSQPFYHEEISNPGTAAFLSAFGGRDELRYTQARGWGVGWDVPLPRLPGHRVQLTFARIHESPLANVPFSSLFGRRRFTPNPIQDVTSGLRNSATLRYCFSSTRMRTWSQTFLEAEVRAAGGALGGDLDFVRWEVNAAPSIRLARRLYLDNRLRAGLATGRLPLQEGFYAGGLGTLPGYADFQFTGDRTLLGRTRLSVVPFGPPEEKDHFRVFAGLDAGNAWQSDRTSGVPRLRTDLAVGIGLFGTHEVGAVFYPLGISVAWVWPLDRGFGGWRFQFDFLSGANR